MNDTSTGKDLVYLFAVYDAKKKDYKFKGVSSFDNRYMHDFENSDVDFYMKTEYCRRKEAGVLVRGVISHLDGLKAAKSKLEASFKDRRLGWERSWDDCPHCANER